MLALLQPERAIHPSIDVLGKSEAMPYGNPLSFDDVSAALAYDPDTGIFTWKVRPAKNVAAGSEAGCVKATRQGRDGKTVSYRYIRLGHEVPAARIAWLLHYGEWPPGKLFFEDGDTLNLRITNLRLGNSLLGKYDMSDPGQRKAYMKEHRATYPRAWKETELQRSFGISLADYSAMVAAQDNKCAICDQPEQQMRGGKLKALAVDHDHASGKIRGLLCADCNQAIGKFKEDRNTLLAAIRYLDKHSDAQNVVPLATREPTS